MNKYNQLELATSKAMTAFDMMNIICTSIDVAKRCINKLDNDPDPRASMKKSLTCIEHDIFSIKDQLADIISDNADKIKDLKED